MTDQLAPNTAPNIAKALVDSETGQIFSYTTRLAARNNMVIVWYDFANKKLVSQAAMNATPELKEQALQQEPTLHAVDRPEGGVPKPLRVEIKPVVAATDAEQKVLADLSKIDIVPVQATHMADPLPILDGIEIANPFGA
jgi:hypothetical protein